MPTTPDHVARAVLVGSLLKPNDQRGRRRVALTFQARDFAVNPSTAGSASICMEDDGNLTASTLRLLSSASSRRTYRHRLYFDWSAQKAGSAIRSILTTGLLVKIVCSGRANDAFGNASTERAVEYILENYSTTILIASNRLDTRQAWFRMKPAAPIAAAFLQFVQDHQLSRFDSSAFSLLRQEIGAVWANADVFRERLLSSPRRGCKPFIGAEGLLPIPGWYSGCMSTATDDLPGWGATNREAPPPRGR